MRLALVDAALAGTPAPATLMAVLTLLRTKGGERIFVFPRAAPALCGALRDDVRTRDESWLDASVAWVLADRPDAGAPPVRVQTRDPLLDRASVVGALDASVVAPLTSSPRVVEMSGNLLCMAVPDATVLAAEPLDNAALWLVGGDGPLVEQRQGHAIVHCRGAVTIVDIRGTDARVRSVDAEGRVVQEGSASLVLATKMTVRGLAS